MDFNLLCMGTLLSLFIRWTVSRFPYSGEGIPPIYGDVEGFRHWMEITTNLPLQEWYVNSSRNDLQYWGFDYPPLTAYHSFICGYIAKLINPAWVAFGSSRGFEGYYFKLFMRYAVVAADFLIFYPAVIFYFYKSGSVERVKTCAVISVLLYPGLILIDHGHFQFNCISLGLVIWALVALNLKYDLLGALAFSLALNYKQMELYHAVPFFCYLLGTCFQHQSKSSGISKFLKLGFTVITTFSGCWFPFFFHKGVPLKVLQRLFPFDRGLYEDKVANIWCSLSVFVKLKQMFAINSLLTISAATTLACLVPSSWNLLRNPSLTQLRLALINSSLIFFLCSFQVHEKSILMAAIIVSLILTEHPLLSVWFLVISVFSMLPLLLKDGLVIPVCATLIIYLFIVMRSFVHRDIRRWTLETKFPVVTLFYTSVSGALALSLAALCILPPARYPDLHTVLCSLYCCGHFVLFAFYFHWLQLKSPKSVDVKLQYTRMKKKN